MATEVASTVWRVLGCVAARRPLRASVASGTVVVLPLPTARLWPEVPRLSMLTGGSQGRLVSKRRILAGRARLTRGTEGFVVSWSTQPGAGLGQGDLLDIADATKIPELVGAVLEELDESKVVDVLGMPTEVEFRRSRDGDLEQAAFRWKDLRVLVTAHRVRLDDQWFAELEPRTVLAPVGL